MNRTLIVIVALAGAAVNAGAQQCGGSLTARDACRKAVDLVNFVSPQFAEALSGGNAMIAQGGSLGGFGKFAVAIRSTQVMGSIPKISDQGFSTAGESRTVYSTTSQLIPALAVDGALGIWRGLPVGLTHIGGLDGLVSVTYMSAVDGGSVKLALEGSNTNFGFGARVGIIEETAMLPGISVSYIKRDMPRFSITGTTTTGNGVTTAGGTIAGTSLLVTTTSLRGTIGKRLGVFDLTGGFGQDKYQSSANVSGAVTGFGSSTGTAVMAITRSNIFGGLALNLGAFKFAGEYGMASGGTAPTSTNDFGEAANKTRAYFTLGARIGF